MWQKINLLQKKLKSVHYLSGILETTVNVEHVDPASNEVAELADELSRKTVSSNRNTMKARKALERVGQSAVSGYLRTWLSDPAKAKDLLPIACPGAKRKIPLICFCEKV